MNPKVLPVPAGWLVNSRVLLVSAGWLVNPRGLPVSAGWLVNPRVLPVSDFPILLLQKLAITPHLFYVGFELRSLHLQSKHFTFCLLSLSPMYMQTYSVLMSFWLLKFISFDLAPLDMNSETR